MKSERNERDVADGVSNKEKKPSGLTDLVDLEEYVTRGLLDIVREIVIFGIGEILGTGPGSYVAQTTSGTTPGEAEVGKPRRLHDGGRLRRQKLCL